ncbi:MAG: hypothetical protein RLY94_457, partial [Chloroflexota bacterium]
MTSAIVAALLSLATAITPVFSALPTARISMTTALSRLKVQAGHTSGYARSKFGDWIDADGDGLDTRAEVLIDESKVKVTISYRTVRTGKWLSLYDNVTWTNASDVDIDHVVALSEAWKSGAHAWSSARRLAFANDLGVSWALRAVTDNVNMSKGDRDPSSWIPSYRAAVCTYLVGWVAVKLRWALSVDAAEKSSITSSWRSAGCSSRAHP